MLVDRPSNLRRASTLVYITKVFETSKRTQISARAGFSYRVVLLRMECVRVQHQESKF